MNQLCFSKYPTYGNTYCVIEKFHNLSRYAGSTVWPRSTSLTTSLPDYTEITVCRYKLRKLRQTKICHLGYMVCCVGKIHWLPHNDIWGPLLPPLGFMRTGGWQVKLYLYVGKLS